MNSLPGNKELSADLKFFILTAKMAFLIPKYKVSSKYIENKFT